ncbi:N-6 DNA methylase [bacterium]|nr:N-6 DNA methylase [bacterium]
MAAPQIILDLVDRFESNLEAYTSGHYNETQLRREFLDPFFTALGWDVANVNGNAEMYKDVIHEDAIKIGGATKAPDYCFQIGGMRKFFLEAKKPSINLKDDINPAFQLRRYAWSAKLPLSILTDFEEFAIYDGRVKPNQGDKPNIARIHYFTYKQYADQWDKIAAIFSRDAVLKGSFDKFAGGKGRRGTAAVDQAFLESISEWRKELAQNLALRNPKLSQHELNYAVQKILDRILFLRICEDRGIENYGRLQGHVNGVGVYKRLCETFQQADERYNSGLFHFQKEKGRSGYPDELTLNLEIDDNLLKHIIKQLYYPESPYEFSVFTADILGQVYEQFLGKVIRLTEGHHAKIEEKPEVKKAGGVYYTPTYIVDYIVNNTVGKLLEGKTPKQAANLKILDPACGSGSFLIGAYQKLLDWHRNFYIKDGIEKWSKGKRTVIFQGRDNDWHLTTSERKRILTNNIFGVDIDSQAVEVTKLSLLLKVLEGESNRTLVHQFKLFHERALPDLSENIKCGNSLIGPDYFNDRLMPDSEELQRVNPFDWEREFLEIMTAGGFDAVIGNPPYIGFHGFKDVKEYFKKSFNSATGKFDIYVLFIEEGLKLLKNKGLLSYICPTGFIKRDHGRGIRRYLLNNCAILSIVDFEHKQIFNNVLNYTGIFVFSKPFQPKNKLIYKHGLIETGDYYFQSKLTENLWVFRSDRDELIVRKIVENNKCAPLSGFVERISEGIVTGLNDVYLFSSKEIASKGFEKSYFKPCLRGKNIRKYYCESHSEYVFYPYDTNGELVEEKTIQEKAPKYYNYLLNQKQKIIARPYFEKSSKKWYELWNQRRVANFENVKIVVPELSDRNRFAIDTKQQYYGDTVCGFFLRGNVVLDIAYILGIINSTLIEWYYKKTTVPKANEFYIYKTMFLKTIPILNVEFSSATDKENHDKMVSLVGRMLELNKQLPVTKENHEKTLIQRQIDATDKEVDRLVYELYGLTEAEIKIVEGESSK